MRKNKAPKEKIPFPLIIKKEEKKLLNVFLKKIPVSIAIFDQHMNYIITSDRWIEETNPPVKDLIGRNHYEVVPDIPLKWKKIHQRCLNGEHLKCEEEMFKRKDGTLEWVKWEVLPWYKMARIVGGIIIFVEHITNRKLIEKKMEEVIHNLNDSKTELENFAHICAHDLNAPLRTISNYAQITTEGFQNFVDPKIKEYLKNISKNVKYMNSIINGILTYVQLAPLKEKTNFFSMQEIVHSVRENLAKPIEDKKASIVWEALPDVYGERDSLTRVIQNLIMNALKYNDKKHPFIHITAKEQSKFWKFCVQDNGIGVDPAHYKKIFELFGRAHPHSQYEGTGIGLAICKKIITSHGGQIWLRSSPQKGSQFFFTLPKPSLVKRKRRLKENRKELKEDLFILEPVMENIPQNFAERQKTRKN